MKIIKLEVENFKRLKAIEITPEGNTVVISGKNAQGKTSILDAIMAALAGAEVKKTTKKPIRDGESKASVTLDLGDIIVTRNWTSNDKSYLKVENKQGMEFKSPQSMLDDLVGRLTFDPLAFVNMRPTEQVKALLECVDIGIDLAAHDRRREVLYQHRTNVNRDVKRLEGSLATMDKPDQNTPTREQSASALLKQIEDARVLERRKASLHSEMSQLKSDIEEAQKKVAILQGQIEAATKQGKQKKKEYEKIKVPDIKDMEVSLSCLESTNALARKAAEYRDTKLELENTQMESDLLTEKIKALDEAKSSAIAKADMPVNGLSFDKDGLILNGIPLTQISSAEQLKVSVAMGMAVNPKLRVLRITDGSLLDSDNMAVIESLAKDGDFQVWIEKVDDTGKVGIYIEDGNIKEATK